MKSSYDGSFYVLDVVIVNSHVAFGRQGSTDSLDELHLNGQLDHASSSRVVEAC